MARHLETNAKRLQAAQERDQARFEAVAAEDRASQGWVDLALSLVTIAVGVAAIVMTAGAATPLVVGAFVVGSGTVAYGASNLFEAGHEIYLGSVGDGLTVASNPLRDTLFMGNDKLYHQVGGLFTTASAALIPIGQTKSVAKGLTEFTIGEVGGFIGGQASYHGTKLLGGSEQDAQRATLVGNILGGFAASSAARRFSLNEPIATRVTKPTYNRQQLLKNLENSRLARESSRFKNYVAREKFTTTLAGMSPEDSQRYIQWHKYAKAGLSPVDRAKFQDWKFTPDFSPAGASFGERALPPFMEKMPKKTYITIKPISNKKGPVAPWFDQPGMGTQYFTDMEVGYLEKYGYLVEID
ncbi:TPA: TNT domain-containing protein [Streptococcus equi subsp. zooepidemicus]|uniref:TNT domain-containing protein n=1 Tax=Streptococcus equi TaxID=1336 RepID=UPI0005B8CC5D|nr:TNT domain-containing protein [Streptococcus equi]KIS13890.1 membrane protein [Streptococcus equi subsp. zooepidemicus SzAM60]HEL0641256.1 TNT domain-containing protein [Streptococcus equi subsp. zooepidemicus]HEL1179339.1 TNT domain-containing protein [Streptococcus equi subsp. zooepidemicus]HEL1236241.1 TNT domain-containing protein [Streptococcus equi subsp. zooepidemicus]